MRIAGESRANSWTIRWESWKLDWSEGRRRSIQFEAFLALLPGFWWRGWVVNSSVDLVMFWVVDWLLGLSSVGSGSLSSTVVPVGGAGIPGLVCIAVNVGFRCLVDSV